MNEQRPASSTGNQPVNQPQLTNTSAVSRWWQRRLDQELDALLFEGIVEAPPTRQVGSEQVACAATADPGDLVVKAVPRFPDDLGAQLWGADSELITDWFDQGDCAEAFALIFEASCGGTEGWDIPPSSVRATQEGL